MLTSFFILNQVPVFNSPPEPPPPPPEPPLPEPEPSSPEFSPVEPPPPTFSELSES